ncbi:cobalt-precorrin 5A hydrolase [Clostridium botulinum]|uniref:Cobalamin biosynthesis protein CbiG n=1 Tax=Clostridium botulinum (strain Langeland / NCTC 10281 / Type F) TaxID=441772 RepID=A7GBZ3_CLOBL|nr:cobalt-precorrin 5A hydrolase [Clostridium botulinum]ABS41591.1 cobalamin biosynthesis protein CbiG [Clostridium botulinum F str. Langeland]ADF98771.1 cobalamin biosynthesis protein CbiG [Clostridium botulinum F str. 230613]KKM39952.1 cobalamin biosynthesis protein CbiG [Clostridium botulinum]MBY6792035.1 cobalt-precorrin 5A hydrolase [Clostridium botulinum]MBY6936044.1 cobalt-precorrin 5A hydrolase [Clostridium botulinum]
MNLEKESRIMKISIINVTRMGNDIAYKIKEHMDADLYSKYVIKELIVEASLEYKHSHCKDSNLNLLNDKHYFKKEDFNFKEIVKKSFQDYDAIIFISSTGIAVRAIAPFIQSKDKDPAVIVIDSTGRYVISLLSGHLGGANELTEKIAKTIGAEPIITTATDNLNIKAPDIIAKENNLVIEDLKKAKDIAALLVNGQKVAFIDEEDLVNFPKGYTYDIESAKGIVFVTNKLHVDEAFLNNKCILKLIRKNIVLGIGCRKNYDDITMKENVIKVLKEENIDLKSINSIVSVEIKKDENAIKELSKFLGCPFITYSIEEIKKVEHKFKGSDFVRKTIGVGSACEPSIELKGGKIIKEKQKLTGMTLAIGEL